VMWWTVFHPLAVASLVSKEEDRRWVFSIGLSYIFSSVKSVCTCLIILFYLINETHIVMQKDSKEKQLHIHVYEQWCCSKSVCERDSKEKKFESMMAFLPTLHSTITIS
jgi:hypothetical protein